METWDDDDEHLPPGFKAVICYTRRPRTVQVDLLDHSNHAYAHTYNELSYSGGSGLHKKWEDTCSPPVFGYPVTADRREIGKGS